MYHIYVLLLMFFCCRWLAYAFTRIEAFCSALQIAFGLSIPYAKRPFLKPFFSTTINNHTT